MSKIPFKGFLSFLVLLLINNKSMTGAEVTEELERRRGNRPSPGTIYPVLKELKDLGLISMDNEKRYSITKKGTKELHMTLHTFLEIFHDFDEMRSCCGGHNCNRYKCHRD
jgi:DNA-binding PadR family transcriptional regulator